MDLKNIGFDAFCQKHLENCQLETYSIGRVCAEYKENYKLFSKYGELLATVSGKFRNDCKIRTEIKFMQLR